MTFGNMIKSFELSRDGVVYYFIGDRVEAGEKYVHDREFKSICSRLLLHLALSI
jgi:hypothetical protein